MGEISHVLEEENLFNNLVLLKVSKMQIKTKMQCHFIPIPWAKIKNCDNTTHTKQLKVFLKN